MIWKGRELNTVGDIIRHGVYKCDTPEEAQEFMRIYRAECPHADRNIGYLSGYHSQKEMRRIQEWFGVSHPVFGNTAPTAEEALGAGKKMAAREDGKIWNEMPVIEP